MGRTKKHQTSVTAKSLLDLMEYHIQYFQDKKLAQNMKKSYSLKRVLKSILISLKSIIRAFQPLITEEIQIGN